MNSLSRALALGLALAPLSCAAASEVDLKTFNATSVELLTDWAAPSSRFELRLNRHETDDCGRLDSSVVATVNGTPLKMISSGDPLTHLTRDGLSCETAVFEGDTKLLTPTTGEETRIEIQDSSHTIAYVVVNAAVERTLSLPGGPGSVRAGSDLLLRWTPESDILNPYVIASLHRGEGQRSVVLPGETVGSDLKYPIPVDCEPRTYQLVVQQNASSRFSQCTGVSKCEQSISANLTLQVEVLPPQP